MVGGVGLPWSAEVRLPEPNWSTGTLQTAWTSLRRRRPTVRSISTGSTWAPPSEPICTDGVCSISGLPE
jgi:hypothetical protein